MAEANGPQLVFAELHSKEIGNLGYMKYEVYLLDSSMLL